MTQIFKNDKIMANAIKEKHSSQHNTKPRACRLSGIKRSASSSEYDGSDEASDNETTSISKQEIFKKIFKNIKDTKECREKSSLNESVSSDSGYSNYSTHAKVSGRKRWRRRRTSSNPVISTEEAKLSHFNVPREKRKKISLEKHRLRYVHQFFVSETYEIPVSDVIITDLCNRIDLLSLD